jgi:hypothetical protein
VGVAANLRAGILVAGLVAPVAELLGTPVLAVLDHVWLRAAGVVLTVVGLLATSAAQLGMGASWRTTADTGERPDLVTTGLFGVVRNPIYSMVTLMVAGLALTVPSLIAVAAVVANVSAPSCRSAWSRSRTCGASTASATAPTPPASAGSCPLSGAAAPDNDRRWRLRCRSVRDRRWRGASW